MNLVDTFLILPFAALGIVGIRLFLASKPKPVEAVAEAPAEPSRPQSPQGTIVDGVRIFTLAELCVLWCDGPAPEHRPSTPQPEPEEVVTPIANVPPVAPTSVDTEIPVADFDVVPLPEVDAATEFEDLEYQIATQSYEPSDEIEAADFDSPTPTPESAPQAAPLKVSSPEVAPPKPAHPEVAVQAPSPKVAPTEAVPPAPTAPAQTVPVETRFKNPEIEEFWRRHCSSATPAHREILADVLDQFDLPGEQDTPSVRQIPGSMKEPDNGYNQTHYGVLAAIPIWKHTLNAAYEFIEATPPKDRSGTLFNLGLIAVLSHDIGKLNLHMKKYYSTGQHADKGANVLDKVIGDKLSHQQRDQILTAIRMHHADSYKGLSRLTTLLRQADIRAREKEFRDSSLVELPGQEVDREDEYDTDHIHIPWFNSKDYLAELGKYINVWENKETYAFTMPTGYVYFTTNVLHKAFEQIAVEINAPELRLYETESQKRELLIYIVKILLKEGHVVNGLIRSNYFSAPFEITFARPEGNIPRTKFLTPFMASSFNVELGELEHKKNLSLKQIISVVPNYKKKGEMSS